MKLALKSKDKSKKALKPKILIDTVSLLSPLTGIGRYTYEIAKQLQKNSNLKLKFFYGGFESKKLLSLSEKKDKQSLKISAVNTPIVKKVLRKLAHILNKTFPSKCDIYWQPSFIPNADIRAKRVITTVHDLSFMLYKDFHPKQRVEHFEKHFLKNIAISDMIITGSNYSKQEIVKELSFTEDKIRVIYHGVDHDIFKVDRSRKTSLDVPKKFILSVGSIEPRKNLEGLLRAYSLLGDQLKTQYKLVLVGFKGWNNKEIMRLIELDRKNIHYLGFVSDEELSKIYNQASCFVYPSFYEGFGLPVLEAMACGVPVVCSESSSLPEVGADAVLYCNPKDKKSIRDKIELILQSQELQEQMMQKGVTQASKFSWEKSTKEHLELFEEVMQDIDNNS